MVADVPDSNDTIWSIDHVPDPGLVCDVVLKDAGERAFELLEFATRPEPVLRIAHEKLLAPLHSFGNLGFKRTPNLEIFLLNLDPVAGRG